MYRFEKLIPRIITKKIMIKFTSCFALLFFTFVSLAQIEVTSGVDKEQLINTLIGEGVEITDVTINCPEVAYGTFSGNSNMGINDGIILTSGSAELAVGPNNQEAAFLTNFSWVEDDDLQGLIPDHDIMDACIIEFSFVPEGDSLSFQYVFGSEEYPEFLEGDYNDVFGFFVSGPGIDGKENIAVVPGTNLPVSIQTINNGQEKLDMATATTSCAGPCVNCEYFMCNGNGDDFFNEDWFFEPFYIQYNGFTTILTAGIGKLQPGAEYRIKLAISDAGDSKFDTGVFIAGKSFSSPPAQLTASGIQGEETFDNAVAGCVDGLFTFTFEEAYSCDVTVNFEIGGTAEAGKDYTGFTNSISIPEGSLKESFQVEILDDGVAGEAKTIELYVTGLSDDSCGSLESDTISLTIEDNPVFAVSEAIEIEKGESTDIEASGGNTYQWTGLDNPAEQIQTVTPEETTDYEVTIGYGRCTETLSTRITVTEMDMIDPCELSISFFDVETCNDTFYAINLAIAGAALGDAISVTDREGNTIGTFTNNNDSRVRLGPIATNQTVLTITNDTNAACPPIELDTTTELQVCLNPSPCSISVVMGSISSCTRNAYDLQLMLTGTEEGDSFTATTANGSDLGSYNYSDMPVLIANIPVDQTVIFIRDNDFTDCTTQTIDISPVIQACVNLVPLCTQIDATPTVTDCTENDFAVSLMVNSNSTGNSFSVSDNLGNNLGIFSYVDVPVSIGSLSLEVTSLTVTDSGNSECSVQTDDLTAAVQECQDSLTMCSITITSAEVSSCTEENYTLRLNVSGTDAGTTFSVSDASGNDLGTYNYADVPVEVTGISISESVLTISDGDEADCSANTTDLTEAIQEACFDDEPPVCSISTVLFTFNACNETNYSASLDVTGENLGTSFSVSDGSGNDLGTYNYADLPFEISGIAISESVLTITDIDGTDCSANSNDLAADIQICTEDEPPACSISAAMATFANCTETSYSILLAVMGDNLGTSFSVSDASGNDLGTYNYADMPVTVSVAAESGIPVTDSTLTITDSNDTACTATTNDLSAEINDCLNPPPPPPCSLTTVMAMVSSCTANDYSAMLNVAGENTGATYTVSDAAGNNLGTFNYSDGPIEISGIPISSNILTVSDVENADCSSVSNDLTTDIQTCIDGLVDMTCSVTAMAMLSSCTENDYTVQLMVSGQNTGDSFTVTNASGNTLGTYSYADPSILISGVATTDNVFVITDSANSACIATTNNIAVEIQACLDALNPSGEVCNVSITELTLIACDEETLSIELIVNSVNVSETFKAVYLDGSIIGDFNYTTSPVQFDNIAITENFLYIIDNIDKSCFALIDLTSQISTCLNDCPDTSAGFLSLEGDYVCDGDSPLANLIDTTVPEGFSTYYVIHNNNNLTPESLSNTQVYSVSGSNFDLNNSLIPCGTSVYVTTVITETGLPDVDLTTSCTTFGNTVETVFLCPISINIEELCNQATGTFVLNVVVKGGLPAIQVESDFDISGDIYTGTTGNEEMISITDLPDGSDYNITATDPSGCTTIISGTITCEKKLPVELIAFSGEATENGNLLKWITASEIENDFFTIDHSLDGINYSPLKAIDGSGTTTEAKSYNFLDRNAANGTTYYRLSQTDFDGTTSIEGIVIITRGESIGVNIAGINPVPFIDELNIQLSSEENIFVRFSLTDLSGKLMLRNEYNLISGLTVVSLDTELFATGLYLLRIETESGSIVKKVIKH